MTPARPPTSLRPSATSSGRWTNEKAIQSAPFSRAKERSARSFSVIADSGNTAFGTLTPLRSDKVPPTKHRVSAKLLPQLSTSSRTLPSSRRSSVPGSSASNISGCGKGARRSSPASRSRSRWKGAPAASSIGPSAKVPRRSFGPCRSARMPIGRPVAPSIRLIAANRARWSLCVPWLKLSRKTSTPASNNARICSGVELEGPSVATILTLRCRRGSIFLPALMLVENQDGSEIIDIGQGGTGHDEITERGKKSISVILGECVRCQDAVRSCTRQTIRKDHGPGVFFRSIDTIGVAGEGSDAVGAVERQCEGEQELDIAPASAFPVTVTVVSPPDKSTAGGDTKHSP